MSPEAMDVDKKRWAFVIIVMGKWVCCMSESHPDGEASHSQPHYTHYYSDLIPSHKHTTPRREKACLTSAFRIIVVLSLCSQAL